MITPNDPAFPYAFQHEDDSRFVSGGFAPGLSVRAHFAAEVFKGILSNSTLFYGAREMTDDSLKWAADTSVKAADALIVALNTPVS